MKLLASPNTPLASKHRRAAELLRSTSMLNGQSSDETPDWLFAGGLRAPFAKNDSDRSQPSGAVYFPPRAPHTLGLGGALDIRAELAQLVTSLSAAECDGALLLLRAVYDVGSASQESIGDLCAEVEAALRRKHEAQHELNRAFDETDQARVAMVSSARKETAARSRDVVDDDDGHESGGDGGGDGGDGGEPANLPPLTGAMLDAARRNVNSSVQYDTTRAVLEARATLSRKQFPAYETAATVRHDLALRRQHDRRNTDALARINDTVISLERGVKPLLVNGH